MLSIHKHLGWLFFALMLAVACAGWWSVAHNSGDHTASPHLQIKPGNSPTM